MTQKSSVPRKAKKKSKTGCRTCRIRRIKCDENPVACHNCTSTGRTCEGYDQYRLPRSNAVVHTVIANGFRWTMTSDERRCFGHFQHHTVPTLLGIFDSLLWQKLVLQMSQSEKAVYHAVVALSAIHQDCEAKGMPMPVQDPRNTWHQFALEQLGRAYADLNRRSASQDPRLRNVMLLCCLLFVLSELLRGEYDDAFVHLQSGLRIIKELKVHRQLFAAAPQEELVEQCLVAAFAHLDIVSAHFGIGGPLLCIDDEPEFNQSYHQECIFRFRTLKQVRRDFDPLLSAVYRFVAPCMALTEAQAQAKYGTLNDKRLYLWAQVVQFKQSFDIFYTNHYTNLNRKGQRFADIIRLQLLGFIFSLRICLAGGDVSTWESFTPDCVHMLSLAENITERFSTRPSVLLEVAVLPPLYHVAISCRDYNVRWRAIQLIRSWPHREGPFDSNWIVYLASEALLLELLAREGENSSITPASSTSPTSGADSLEEDLSPQEILERLQRDRHKLQPVPARKIMRDLDQVSSPADDFSSVKCMANWSCVRAFVAFTSKNSKT